VRNIRGQNKARPDQEGNGVLAYRIGIALLLFSWFLLARSILIGNKMLVVLSIALIAMNNYSIGRWRERIGGPQNR